MKLSGRWWYVERPFPVGLILVYVVPALIILGLFAIAIVVGSSR